MVDEVLRFGGSSTSPGNSADPSFGSIPAPWGFAGRYSPAGLTGFSADFIPLSAGRTGVLLGSCSNTTVLAEVRVAARAALLGSGDPLPALGEATASDFSAICAVIDGDTIGYGGVGHPGAAIAAPGVAPEFLTFPQDRLAVAPLTPGATVLFWTGAVSVSAALLDGCAGMYPAPLADRVIAGLAARDHQSSAALLYRHPPEPLRITLDAEPARLAVSRGMLRDWLNRAGLDSETCADVLLAAGEATANATEHAVLGAPAAVQITLEADFEPGTLRLSISDNGRWKPASGSPGHRGHGIHLMNALMKSVEMKTDPQGTTVTMVKELPR